MVAGYFFQGPLLFSKISVPKTCQSKGLGTSDTANSSTLSTFSTLHILATFTNKNALSASLKGHCAQDWIRTSTPFPALPPQGSASTNFATWAFILFKDQK